MFEFSTSREVGVYLFPCLEFRIKLPCIAEKCWLVDVMVVHVSVTDVKFSSIRTRNVIITCSRSIRVPWRSVLSRRKLWPLINDTIIRMWDRTAQQQQYIHQAWSFLPHYFVFPNRTERGRGAWVGNRAQNKPEQGELGAALMNSLKNAHFFRKVPRDITEVHHSMLHSLMIGDRRDRYHRRQPTVEQSVSLVLLWW